MTKMNVQYANSAPCNKELSRARKDVFAAVIPDFAERFPEQIEHAVIEVANYRLRERCTAGEKIAC